MRHKATLAALSSVVVELCACAFALNPDRDIHQLAHRSKDEKDGYPGNAQAVAQTTDGFCGSAPIPGSKAGYSRRLMKLLRDGEQEALPLMQMLNQSL